MKPLKVLILITKSNWGGAQRYVYDLATGLDKAVFQVEVLAGSEGPLISKLAAAGISAEGSLRLGRDIAWTDDLRAFFRLVSILREKRPDVLHLNSSKIGGLGALAGRLAGVRRIVFTAHGWAFNEDRPFLEKAAIVFSYWITMMLAHRTIAVSEAAGRQVRPWPFIEAKLSVIHNGTGKGAGFAKKNARLELSRLSPGLRAALEGVPESNLLWLGTIAELHPIKGHRYAIEAVADCIEELRRSRPNKKVVYTMIGDGEERELIRGMIAEKGLEGSIFLLGHVDGAAEYASAFDIFLLASLSEGLSYVLLEAGAAGVPVVATAVGGIPEVIDDMGSGILVQPRKPRELAHAILFLTEHARERRAYGAALRDKVLRSFSLENMIKEASRAYSTDLT